MVGCHLDPDALGVGADPECPSPDAGLGAFASALGAEAHVLARRPDLMWQQVHNRLAGGIAEPVLLEERDRRTRESPRPWLWAHALAPASSDLLRMFVHDELGWLRACAVAPDSTFIVAGGEAGRDPARDVARDSSPILVVWDLETGIERSVLRGHTGDVRGCAVAPDASFVVSASIDGTARIWDPVSGSERASIAAHEGSVLGCAVAIDGRSLATCGHGGAKLWRAGSWTQLGSLDLARATDVVHALAFAPSGDVMVGVGGRVAWWDVASSDIRWLGDDEEAHETVVASCAVAPDGTWAASAAGREVRIWDLDTRSCRGTLPTQTDWIEAVTSAPDGTFLVTAGRDGTLRSWDPSTGGELACYRGHDGWVEGCVTSPDGTRLLSVGRDGTTRLWNVPPRFEERPEPGRDDEEGAASPTVFAAARWVLLRGPSPIPDVGGSVGPALSVYPSRSDGSCFAMTPDRTTAVVGRHGEYVAWNPATGEERSGAVPSWSSGAGTDVCAISPDGTWLVAATRGRLRVWDLRSRRDLGMYRGGTDPVTGTAFSHSGADITDCSIAPDGRWVASADAGGTIRSWSSDDGPAPAGPSGIRGHRCAISPDGTWMAAVGSDGAVAIAPTSGPAGRRAVGSHGDAVTACAITPDASFVVSGGNDRSIRIWDPTAGREVAAAFLDSTISALVCHPWKPWVACQTEFGEVFIEVVGIAYGPIVVTVRGPDGPIRCPACRREWPVEADGLGRTSVCPDRSCGLPVRIAPTSMREGPPVGLFDDSENEIRRQYGDA